MLPITVTTRAHQYTPAGLEPVDLMVSAEYHVTLLLSGKPCVSIACSGADLDVLAVGHLISEGIILSKDEIARVDVDEKTFTVNIVLAPDADVFGRLIRIRTLVSGCGGTGPELPADRPASPDLPVVRPAVVLASMKEFLGLSDTHRQTHGVHSGALYDLDGARIAFFDEIGRHNAVDKLLGFALANDISLDGVMLLSTGRISTEIVLKAAQAGIRVLVTRASPTSRAIELVRERNIMMITGVRRETFYVHHGAENIR